MRTGILLDGYEIWISNIQYPALLNNNIMILSMANAMLAHHIILLDRGIVMKTLWVLMLMWHATLAQIPCDDEYGGQFTEN